MEFLVIAVGFVVAAFFGYHYYKTKTSIGIKEDVLDLVQEARVEVKAVDAKAEVATVEVKAAPAKKAPKSPAKAEVAAKRTRKSGKFVGDDKSTPEVNEAFKDGKAPAKKTTKKPSIKIAK